MGFERATPGILGPGLFGSSPTATLELLRAVWRLAVGPELARRTRVLAVEGRTLRVRVPDGRWRRQLHRMQGDILRRLRAELGAACPVRLGLSEGAVEPAEPPPPPAEPAAPPQALPAVCAAAEAIGDAEIRQAFVRTASLYLDRAARRDRP